MLQNKVLAYFKKYGIPYTVEKVKLVNRAGVPQGTRRAKVTKTMVDDLIEAMKATTHDSRGHKIGYQRQGTFKRLREFQRGLDV